MVLKNTKQGQFRSATVADRFTDFLDEESRRALFSQSSRRGHLIDFLEEELEPALLNLLERHGFSGPLGVDAFLYRDVDRELCFKPVVEINPRYTMGRVAAELARFTPSNATTTLTIGKAGARTPSGSIRLTPDLPEARFAASV